MSAMRADDACEAALHPPCCGPACKGVSCWDCRGTGHPHPLPYDPKDQPMSALPYVLLAARELNLLRPVPGGGDPWVWTAFVHREAAADAPVMAAVRAEAARHVAEGAGVPLEQVLTVHFSDAYMAGVVARHGVPGPLFEQDWSWPERLGGLLAWHPGWPVTAATEEAGQ